jgi:LemA protein
MKLFQSFVILLFFLSSQSCFGQDATAEINESWSRLKTQLQRRTDIVSNLISILSQSSKINKKQLNNSNVFALDLSKCIDTLSPKDSLSVSLAKIKNNNLTQAFAKTLATLENSRKFRANNQISGLLMQLEGCENRISLATQEYSETCKKFKRTDLLFGSDQIEKVPEVKF